MPAKKELVGASPRLQFDVDYTRIGAMLAIIILLFLAVAATAIGLVAGAQRMDSPSFWALHKKIDLVYLSIMTGVAIFFLLKAAEEYIPASDLSRFKHIDRFGITQTQLTIRQSRSCVATAQGIVCEAVPRTVTAVSELTIAYPPEVPEYKDFIVSLLIQDENNIFDHKSYYGLLFGPTYIEIRSSQRCKDMKEIEAVKVSACPSMEGARNAGELVWDLTPTRTGSPILAIQSPLIARIPPGASGIPTSMLIREGDREVDASTSEPFLSVGDAVVDFGRNEIRFPIKVVTTLGVTQSVYDWMKVVGAVIGALGTLLGAGFAASYLGKEKSKQ